MKKENLWRRPKKLKYKSIWDIILGGGENGEEEEE